MMGQNPAVVESLEKLRSWGVEILFGPSVEGEAKIASPEEVAAAVLHRLGSGPWKGTRVTVVGGASREPIDAVRSVTNESSGATAVALATQAFYRGADVELWAGALQVPVPSWIPVHRWSGVADLLNLATKRRKELARSAAILVPAALSDFTLHPAGGKIPSRGTPKLTLTLVRAPKVLPELATARPGAHAIDRVQAARGRGTGRSRAGRSPPRRRGRGGLGGRERRVSHGQRGRERARAAARGAPTLDPGTQGRCRGETAR